MRKFKKIYRENLDILGVALGLIYLVYDVIHRNF